MRGIEAVADKLDIDLHIVSAGYGLIPADRRIAPYECTFSGRGRNDLKEWSNELGIPEAFRARMAEPYDLALWLLGDDYLGACWVNSHLKLASPTIAFCGRTTIRNLPKIDRLKSVPLSNPEAKRFSCGLVALKGELAAQLLAKLAKCNNRVSDLTAPDVDLLALLEDAGDL